MAQNVVPGTGRGVSPTPGSGRLLAPARRKLGTARGEIYGLFCHRTHDLLLEIKQTKAEHTTFPLNRNHLPGKGI